MCVYTIREDEPRAAHIRLLIFVIFLMPRPFYTHPACNGQTKERRRSNNARIYSPFAREQFITVFYAHYVHKL